MQRLYSEFPAAYPGLGLLLLRLVTCGILIKFGRVTATLEESHTVAKSLPTDLLIAAGVLILAGFLTPIAGLLVAAVEGIGILQTINSAIGVERDWINSVLIAGAASTLTLTGPGGFSLDARIFGPKRFCIPMGNPAGEGRRPRCTHS